MSPSVVSPIPLTPLSPDGALNHLRGYSDWEAFADELEEIRLRVDLSSVAKISNMSLKTFDVIIYYSTNTVISLVMNR